MSVWRVVVLWLLPPPLILVLLIILPLPRYEKQLAAFSFAGVGGEAAKQRELGSGHVVSSCARGDAASRWRSSPAP
jgi:hypothetical protein